MKQSTSRKNRDATAFLYLRLSRDDNLEGESYSIGNQDAICQGQFLRKIKLLYFPIWYDDSR